MTEELIKFETAVLAKEKGFDEQTRNAFDENGEEIFCDPCSNSVRLVGLGNRQGHKWWNSKEIGKYARPSQFLLQRWLREVHKIHIEILYGQKANSENEYWYYTTIQVDKKKKKTLVCNDDYEEALENALVQALNLI
jgi:hypothetical protein